MKLMSAEAPSTNPQEGGSSAPSEDSTRDPLILNIFNMMSAWNERISKLEKSNASKPAEKEIVRSPSQQAAVDLVEQAFAPRQSPSSSPLKGLKSVADERRYLKRGGDQGISPLSKVKRVSRETAQVREPAIAGTRQLAISAPATNVAFVSDVNGRAGYPLSPIVNVRSRGALPLIVTPVKLIKLL